MAKPITFSRNLNIDWLNAVADYRLAGMTREDAASTLNTLVGQRIASKDNIRKSRTLLLSIWYDNAPWFLEQAETACRGLPHTQWLPVHWALMLAKFPIFHDVCDVAGKLLEYKECITLAQIKQRVFEKWGARNTMLHTLPKVVQTLKDIQALEPGKEKGTYSSHHWIVDDVKVVTLLTAALLVCNDRPHMTWSAISQDPAIFPFEIRGVGQADVVSCERLSLERSGNDVVIRLKL